MTKRPFFSTVAAKVKTRSVLVRLAVAAAVFALSMVTLPAQSSTADKQKSADQAAQRQTRVTDANGRVHTRVKPITQAEREAAAARLKALMGAAALRSGLAVSGATSAGLMAIPAAQLQMGPNGQLIPDYSGATPNYANSPVPRFDFSGNWIAGSGMRKFVDGLPGLGAAGANNLGQYIPIAVPNTTRYPGADYYEIELGQYTEKLHSDLPATTLRGYRQIDNTAGTVLTPFHYLGPLIIAQRGRPVRITFFNRLPAGVAGDLFLPVDPTIMGAGPGPNAPQNGTSPDVMCAQTPNSCYRQNRATLHLHGGVTPWISDGTTHQWITPGNDTTPYPKGVSVYNVPDMPNPGKPPATNAADPSRGVQTFYYTNDQSARLMFYHDHAMGITRLNVYAGEAAGYLLQDTVEQDLVTRGVIPATQIPLVIQDKTFVWGTRTPANWGTGPIVNGLRQPKLGDLWWPHVYMPAQNPYDPSGLNPMGRWHYGPWFWPPAPIAAPPVPNPYYDPVNAPWQPPQIPGTPNPSWGAEAFMDTPVINGTAYPTLTVDPKAYRFRILNAAHDRFWNLQLYVADSNVTTVDNRINTEVKMVPASPAIGLPPNWPADGREGGLPDPTTVGPDFVQIGTEGGFLPMPVVVPNQPIAWNMDPTTFNFGNVSDHALLLGPAERADVIVDFSAFAGKTLILYNDAPAAFPALDARNDYYTGAPDRRDTGGVDTTRAGFGPNIRTIMQIKINTAGAAAPYDVARLMTEFAPAPTAVPPRPGVFQRGQDPIIVGQSAYDQAYGRAFPTEWPYWGYARIQDFSMPIETVDGTRPVDPMPFQTKAIHDEMGATFDDYGRMSAKLGLEIPNANPVTAGFIMQGYADPPTELVRLSATAVPIGTPAADGTQIWKITHNGVDTHPVHFHLFHVQLLNRVGWDGAIRAPDANELGWKDTLRISPLEDTIVALRPIVPLPTSLPWPLPNSFRPLNPVLPLGSTLGFSGVDPAGNPVTVTNEIANFGWEYVWHCHILSHEENDMMRSIVFAVPPTAPGGLTRTILGTSVRLNWANTASTATSFTVQRATDATFATALATIPLGLVTTYTDSPGPGTYFYRVFATNTAGSTVPGYPQIAADSPVSATVGPVTISLGRLDVTPAAMDFLPQRLNLFSSAQVLTLTNTGNASITINSRTLGGVDAAQFQQQATTCGTTLAGGASCTVSLRYRPTSLGPKSATLTIASNDVSRPTIAVPLTGAGTQLVITPTSLTFANQAVNTTSAFQTLTLTNFGTTRINGGFVVSFTGGNPTEFNRVGGAVNNCGTGLNAGATCTIRVTFRPTGGGARTAVLNLANSEPTNPRTVALAGTGLAPALTVAPTTLTFASQALNTTSAAQTVTVTNSGTTPMTISGITRSGINAGQFANTTCPASLAAGASCTVNVTFTPTAVGTITASLNVNVAAPAVSGTVALSGVGASTPAPALGLSPSGLSFGNQTMNTPSLPQTVTLSNTGTGAMSINAIGVGGSTAQYPIAHTCPMAPLTLAAGGSCTVDVTFSPTAAAVFNGSLNVTMAPAVLPAVTGGVTLTGTGVAGATYGVSGGVGAAGGGATLTLSTGPTVTADPASGLYAFTGLANGTYTVTPTKAGFTFAPASLTVQVAGANVANVNFVATSTTTTFSVAGSVGAAGAGATLTLSPGGLTATADAAGAFTIPGVANGSYTLTPALTGFSFAPASAPVTVNNANVTGLAFTATPTASTFAVSGSLGTGGANGVVTLTPGGLTATASATGAYTITGVAPGTYTATPTKAGVVFAPVSSQVPVTNANVTGVNFTATFTISGSVGLPGAGATMTLNPGARTTPADANGNFLFTGVANNTYTVTPAKTGYTFTPANAPAIVNGASVTGLTFTATLITYSISGSVGAAGGGATMTLTGGAAPVTVTANATTGAYTFTGVAPGNYAVTPSKGGVAFAPLSTAVPVVGANVTGVNFTPTFTISGSVGATGGGATMTLTGGAAPVTVTADPTTGNYTFAGVAPGNYTVTPSKTGFAFTPISAAVPVVAASVAGVNFTAAAAADPAPVGSPVEAQGLGTRSVTVTTATPGLLLVAFVGSDGPAGANLQSTTISGGAGLTWTRARQQRGASGVAEIWTARAANAGTYTITSTLQNAAFQQRLSVLAFANVSAIGANGGTSGTATSAATTSVTAQAAGSLVYAVGNDWSNIAARTFPATQSVVGSQFLATGLVAVWVQRLNGLTTAAGAVTMNTSGPTSNAWNLAAIELRR